MEKIYAEAQKMGLDIGDLETYGIDLKGMRIVAESYDEFSMKMNMLFENILVSVASTMGYHYQRALCNPTFKKHVHPKVQFVYPFTEISVYTLGICNICCLPCCYVLIPCRFLLCPLDCVGWTFYCCTTGNMCTLLLFSPILCIIKGSETIFAAPPA